MIARLNLPHGAPTLTSFAAPRGGSSAVRAAGRALMPPSPRHVRWVGAGCALAVLAIWTSFIVIARVSARHTLTPYDIAFMRFAFSGLVALPFFLWRPKTLSAGRLVALTLSAGVGYCLLAYSGFFFAPAAHAAVLMPGSLPLWTALFAFIALGERVSAARLAGLALIVAGGLLVGGSSLLQAFDGGRTWLGDVLFLCAGMSWSVYGVLCRRWRVGAIDATLAIAVGTLASYVPVYAVAAAAGWLPSGLAAAPWRELALQAVYQGGFAMLIAGIAFTQVVATCGPVRTTLLTALVPSLAALAAVPVLGEPLSGAALGGLVCVTAGLLLGLRPARAPRPALECSA
jgi:drug/metabolite transporter (DMT)-like permease